ncbi:fasciclin domain-containing protein [Treponema brennaborense]|uniref:Beta-Ig-H3/fasciclin n=1 Tax=Treponema brennaborense (strain DSM 12168 / CIP 105900 / DD5/3) TaxID=906968 RepID=F4LIR7_TREBD|nr:fasciclin domain-containing protein [Treponema brennaborense]AEE16242.1 beta-Ig-H3/fasciclin [Treponema brennaborense DSM 12168]
MKRVFFLVTVLALVTAGSVFAQNGTDIIDRIGTESAEISDSTAAEPENAEVPEAIAAEPESAEVPEAIAATESKSEAYDELKEAVENDADLTVFAQALAQADIDASVLEKGVTAFIPVDGSEPDAAQLANSITDYLVAGKLTTEELFMKSSITALSGKELPIQIRGNTFTVNGSALVGLDSINTGSIVVHKIAETFTDFRVSIK